MRLWYNAYRAYMAAQNPEFKAYWLRVMRELGNRELH